MPGAAAPDKIPGKCHFARPIDTPDFGVVIYEQLAKYYER